MRPNLTYLTVADGVVEQVELDADLHKNSIRHLAHQDGTVAFAMQWQGDLPDAVPLLGTHRRGHTAQLCTADLAEQLQMQGYAGSVAIADNRIAITSPRGGRVHLFGLDGTYQRAILRGDVCGVARARQGLILTDGLGGILSVHGDRLTPMRAVDRAWDNHLVRVAS